jgi:RNA polymerase sigma-32 factor
VRLAANDMSLNAPLTESDGAESSERMDFLVDNAPLPDETVSDMIDSERRIHWLRSALNVLSERELRILRERRLSEEAATLEALGDRLGISKERVRQIETRALEKLRAALVQRAPEQAFA